MIRRRWMRWVAVGAVAAVALTGCVGEDEPEPSPSIDGASPSPAVSASPDEWVGDARSVYESYMAALPEFYASPSPDYTALLEWSTDEVATNEAASAADLAANGLTLQGVPTVLAVIVVPDSDPSATQLELGICSDVSATRFVNADGADVTPADRPNPAPLAVSFERADVERQWLISGMGPWTLDEQPCP